MTAIAINPKTQEVLCGSGGEEVTWLGVGVGVGVGLGLGLALEEVLCGSGGEEVC